MNQAAMHAYKQMLEDINGFALDCTNEILLVEGCFNIALLYCNRIKKYAQLHLFKHAADEIYFFKHIKPLFLAAMEYYTLRYQAIFFKPVNDKGELAQYWIQQVKRIHLFYRRHAEFYAYYIAGKTGSDELYFTRPQYKADTRHKGYQHLKATKSYVHIAACILGYQQYHEYVMAELEKLNFKDVPLPEPVAVKQETIHSLNQLQPVQTFADEVDAGQGAVMLFR